jgi:acylphosphatase
VIGDKIHRVGYRAPVIAKAFSLGMDHFSIFNSELDGREAVIALVDAEKTVVDEFRRFVESHRPPGSDVVEIREEKYDGDIPTIERTMQAFQTEQWAEGIPILLEIRGNTQPIPEMAENIKIIRERQEEHIKITKEGFMRLTKGQDAILSKQDDMLSKQDDMLSKQDDMLSKHDEHIAITKEGFESVVTELRGFKALHDEIMELRVEFERLKKSVARIERKIEA